MLGAAAVAASAVVFAVAAVAEFVVFVKIQCHIPKH